MPPTRPRAVWRLVVVAAAVLGLLGVPAPRPAAALDTGDRAAVVAAYQTYAAAQKVPFSWTGSTASCTPGAPSPAYRQAQLDIVNYFRTMAGSDPVTFDPALDTKAQYHALVMAAKGQWTHNPDSTWPCYSAANYSGGNYAKEIAATSNVAVGAPTWLKPIDLYMDDSWLPSVAHRRWVLNPLTKTMGLGAAQGSTMRSNDLVVFGKGVQVGAPSTVSNPYGQPWPSAGWFPQQTLAQGYWSFGGQAGVSWDFSGTTIKVVDETGATLATTRQPEEDWFGADTLVWQMPTLPMPTGSDVDTYTVTLTGMKRAGVLQGAYTYTVKVFDATASQYVDSASAPDLYGAPQVGQTLEATLAPWQPTPTSMAWQWLRDGVAIPGATGRTYVVSAADLGAQLSVQVTGTRPGLPATTQTSKTVGPITQASVATTASAGLLVPVQPRRILDTRVGLNAAGAVGANQSIKVQVAGRGGVPWGAGSAVLNLTAVDPQAPGFLAAAPTQGSPTSSVNFPAGRNVANLVTAPIAADGTVTILHGGPEGGVDVVADVTGWYHPGAPQAAGAYGAVPAARLLDTRPEYGGSGPVKPFGAATLKVTGVAGVPASGVSAVVLNLTVVDPTRPGHADVYPTGQVPSVSTVNFVPGQIVANMVTVKVSPGGTVDIRNWAQDPTNVVVDIAGYYRAGAPTQPGAFVPLDPTRFLDTRESSAIPAFGTRTVYVGGNGGVPSSGVAAVATNLTAVANGDGYFAAYPAGTTRPDSSTVNFAAGQVVANAAITRVASGGAFSLTNWSQAANHGIVDVAGYFLG